LAQPSLVHPGIVRQSNIDRSIVGHITLLPIKFITKQLFTVRYNQWIVS